MQQASLTHWVPMAPGEGSFSSHATLEEIGIQGRLDGWYMATGPVDPAEDPAWPSWGGQFTIEVGVVAAADLVGGTVTVRLEGGRVGRIVIDSHSCKHVAYFKGLDPCPY